MKKKTLPILLVIPFIIGLLTFVSVMVLNNTVASDIDDILIPYKGVEGFKLDSFNNRYELVASVVINDPNLLLATGSKELTWSVNTSKTDPVAKIENENNKFYLVPLKEGECDVIVKNVRGTHQKSFKAVIYENGTIIINPKNAPSLSNIDSTTYYGEYDLKYTNVELDKYETKQAEFELMFDVLSDETNSDEVVFKSSSSNVYVDEFNKVKIIGSGEGYVEFASKEVAYLSSIYKFNIIEDGINVYSYNDLLMCTNFSTSGEKVVLQTNLESLASTFKTDENNEYINSYLKENTKLFGNYDFKTKTFNFNNELYTFTSTYNHTYIDTYNKAKKGTSGYKEFEPLVKAGIHLTKDLYGNGYTINMSNLCYPNNGKISSETQKLTPDKDKDYFFGPLPLVTIGSLSEMSVVKAFGQDNIGLYLDGDNLVINDVKLRNTNNIDNMYNLYYTGTVIEVNGNNNTIKNSVMSHGKNVLRAFSTNNLLVENSILHTGEEFLAKLGSNKINKVDTSKNISINYNDSIINDSFNHFYDTTNENASKEGKIVSDTILSDVLMNDTSSLNMDILRTLGEGLDNVVGIINEDSSINYDGSITFKDTSFYNSGIFSIALESSFNGPYLYNGYPSLLLQLLDVFEAVAPSMVGGTSFPILVYLEGKTKFYDYKDPDTIDASSLVEENISKALNRDEIGIDDFFPMKKILKQRCIDLNYIVNKDNTNYINTPIAYYGGGLNLSKVINNITISDNTFSEDIVVDVSELTFTTNITSNLGQFLTILAKCVSLATGFHPFRFITNDVETDPKLLNKAPTIEDLKTNLMEEIQNEEQI